jgi:hypothetical protein
MKILIKNIESTIDSAELNLLNNKFELPKNQIKKGIWFEIELQNLQKIRVRL